MPKFQAEDFVFELSNTGEDFYELLFEVKAPGKADNDRVAAWNACDTPECRNRLFRFQQLIESCEGIRAYDIVEENGKSRLSVLPYMIDTLKWCY